jgi:MFS family permease
MSIHTSDDQSQRYPHWRRNRVVMPLANLICGLGFNLVWPFVPLMVRGLGVGENLETWVGYMLMVFYLVSFAVSPIWGGIADHYGRKSMVLRAGFGMGVGFAVLSTMSTPLGFLGILVLVGLANGFVPAGQALVAMSTPRHGFHEPSRAARRLQHAEGFFVPCVAVPPHHLLEKACFQFGVLR